MLNLNLHALKKKRIIIFASGGGSNTKKIIEYFSQPNSLAEVILVVSNKSSAPVLAIAREKGVSTKVASDSVLNSDEFIKTLKDADPSLIVLAGFLLKIPKKFIQSFNNAIVNIHPALLPKYGGKGMYGMNVHKAVVEAGESKTGMTIHWVNENYDEGLIIEQKECSVLPADNAEDVAKRVLELEHEYYPKTIEKLLKYGI